MNEYPLVSILLLSMNHEQFIKKCVDSLANQTYQNIEIIYLDNASTDNTFEIASKHIKSLSFPYKIFRNEYSEPISKNVDFLYGQSRGDFIATLSTDDWWKENNVDLKADILSKNPQAGMVYSDGFLYTDESNKKLFSQQDRTYSGNILHRILLYNFIKAPSVMLRRKVLEVVGNYDTKLDIEDWDMWIRIAEKFPILYCNQPTVFYRVSHGANISSNQPFMVKAVDQIIQKYSDKYPVEMKTVLRKNILKEATYRTNEKTVSFNWLMKNLQINIPYFKLIIKNVFNVN
ncbi:MAG: glycosyltransferase [Ginsengibacter sp.]